MNIQEAKDEIKQAVIAYLDKDESGVYTIPVVRQRPIFMVGAPGIGKTAIVEQIAAELDLALVSYSMTHHTRQSALGLPVIETKLYGGEEVTVSEYTMSEIIAAMYQAMEASGKTEGILFLDEINCISETLAPAMLQFLQYKVFGNRQIPQGWVIVTAGNPPEYNRCVREFDVATMDRLRCLKITEDFEVWKQYAGRHGVHPAVIAFLETNRQCFYSIQASVDGTKYVTARGWEDLSTAMKIYEKKGFAVDRNLMGQYLADEEIVRKFHVYYHLYQKYRADYRVEEILDGIVTEELMQKARAAAVDERFSLIGLLLGYLNEGFAACLTGKRRQAAKSVQLWRTRLENAFAFIEQVWGCGQEMVYFVTELTAGAKSMEFISKWGSESYFRYNKELLTYDMREELRAQIDRIL